MRSYYLILEKLLEVAQEDRQVNTVTNGDNANLDIDEKNIYPLVDIVCVDAPMTSSTITYNFLITVVDIRDANPEPRIDKFIGNDNKQDNLNTTMAILKRIYLRIKKFGDDFDIPEDPTANPVVYQFENTLDGWQMNVGIEMGHDQIEVC